jgi:hypothetical protein
MDMRPTRAANLGGVLLGLTCLGMAGGLTYPLWRTWCLTWGATADEVDASLPGDDLLTDPDVITTRAIHLGVPPARTWPWLVQMGPGRAGAYTYDWIENLAGLNMHSADEIIPEYQHLEVGDGWRLGARGPVLRVASIEPDTSLVLRSDDGNWVWAFVLARAGTGSRLVSRNRIRQPGASWLGGMITRYVMEPGSLVMERKMLLGIKERAERPAVPAGRTASLHSEPTSRHHAAPSSGAAAASS